MSANRPPGPQRPDPQRPGPQRPGPQRSGPGGPGRQPPGSRPRGGPQPPEVDLPEVDLPDVDLPDVGLPDVGLPDVEIPGERLVDLLATDQPLALLPVRVATRFHRPTPGAQPDELRVRIFPDLLHADGHTPELAATEIAAGQAYWERTWRAGPGGSPDADRWLVGVLGGPRAAWVALQTRPANPGQSPAMPVDDDAPLQPPPRWPALTPREHAGPTVARLLPRRWLVVVRRSEEYVLRVWSSPVQPDLVMAPNLVDLPDGAGARDLLSAQGLEWMVDYDAALAAGMAVSVPWEQVPGVPRAVTELLVIGVRGPADATSELAALLDAHRFTSGLEIVAPGTPTNNTESVPAGPDAATGDPSFLRRQLSGPQGPRPPLPSPPRLGRLAAADALAVALGLTGPTAFDFAEHAAQRWIRSAAAMNRTLFPATWGNALGRLLATPGGGPLSGEDLTWLAGWMRDWVRGGGFLPAFRVGDQPYGVLPVRRRPGYGEEVAVGREGMLEAVLRDLSRWRDSRWAVPSYAEPAGLKGGPAPTPSEEAARLAAVLGAVPHPLAFRLREAPQVRPELTEDWVREVAVMEGLIRGSSPRLWQDTYENEEKARLAEGDLVDQGFSLSRLRDVADDIATGPYPPEYRDAAVLARDHLDDVLRPMVAAHMVRSELRHSVGTPDWQSAFSGAHLPTADDPPLWYVRYGQDGSAADGTFPTLRLVPEATAADLAASLRDYAATARRAGAWPRPGFPAPVPASLLDKLVQQAVMTVPAADCEELALGLEGLADALADEDAPVADPVAELARLLRETLGTAVHRYDAWASSPANRRLATLRSSRPTGLQVGAFGLLVNLAPEAPAPGGPRETRGFVHAPSLDHAATAAVLRSAWLAYADSATDAPFGVDLSSGRVRTAQWLLDGVRNGVDLAELLGARLERRLHDRGLAHLVADVREQVGEATGARGTPGASIVDGLAVAVASSPSTPDDDPVRTALDRLLAAQVGPARARLDSALRATVGDLDATNDLLTAQAVHSLVKGNLAEAAAVLGTAGAGEGGVPPMRIPEIPRDGVLVEHRVLAMLPAPDPSPGTLGSAAHPGLQPWFAAALPPLGTVRVVAGTADGAHWESDLASLGIGPVELVALAPTDGGVASGRLGALLRTLAAAAMDLADGRAVVLNAEAGPEPTLSEVSVAAGALRSAVGAARPLRPSDLASSEVAADTVGMVDLDELEARRDAVATVLESLAAAQPGRTALLAHLPSLALIEPEGLTWALAAPDGAEATARAAVLFAAAAGRASALREPLAADLTHDVQAQRLLERLSAAVPGIPVVPRIVPADPAGLAAAFGAAHPPADGPLPVLGWLLEAGRVHPGAGRCAEAADLLEAVHPSGALEPRVAQLPASATPTSWLAVTRPVSGGPRLHVVSLTDPRGALGGTGVCGLLFDAWSELVPSASVTTGVALHLDSPGARAPQALLLLTPPVEGPWTVAELETQVRQTLELAQVRAVGPAALQGYGQMVPAVFLPTGVAVETVGAGSPAREERERRP